MQKNARRGRQQRDRRGLEIQQRATDEMSVAEAQLAVLREAAELRRQRSLKAAAEVLEQLTKTEMDCQ